jgi:cyclophilin family peptidyl-prolyl cis-trans isomerase
MRPPRLPLLALSLLLFAAPTARAACDTTGLPDGTQVAELVTSLGSVCFELLDDDAPGHVDNFLYYLENGLITDTFFHRSVASFVLQGASFTIGSGLPQPVPARPPGTGVTNEPCTLDTEAPGQPGVMICSERGNERGTVALAKLGNMPNSGTASWFINLADNRAGGAQLDSQNGGFTVFARVFQGMDVVDAIAALTRATRNDLIWLGSQHGLVPAAQFTFTAPLLEPPLYAVAGQYGCFDPQQQVTILNPQSTPTAYAPVLDPIDPTLLYHTLSSPCGQPITRATFVANPGPISCPDVDRIGVSTNGPASLGCLASGLPVQNCANGSHFEFTCAQAAEALAQRQLWRADFQEHFLQQLVYVESATLTTVPEPGAAGNALVALAALGLRRGAGARRAA